MTLIQPILAEGFPGGLIFAIAMAVIVGVANALAKKSKEKESPFKVEPNGGNGSRRGPQNQRGRDARRTVRDQPSAQDILERMKQEQAAREAHYRAQQHRDAPRNTPAPPPLPGTRRKGKKANRAAAATQTPPVRSEPPVSARPSAPVDDAPIALQPSERISETAQNLRLMLQPSGIREALLLGEIIGKPKSLREE